jgi:hypothetical protein
MTLLQRGVVQRLRDRGYNALADAAAAAWGADEQLNMPNVVSDREKELRADYEKANSQASRQ